MRRRVDNLALMKAIRVEPWRERRRLARNLVMTSVRRAGGGRENAESRGVLFRRRMNNLLSRRRRRHCNVVVGK